MLIIETLLSFHVKLRDCSIYYSSRVITIIVVTIENRSENDNSIIHLSQRIKSRRDEIDSRTLSVYDGNMLLTGLKSWQQSWPMPGLRVQR